MVMYLINKNINNLVRLVRKNDVNRVLAIGDVHGEFSAFKKILPDIEQHLTEDKKNIVVFLGDLIDRGLYSYNVVDCVIKLKEKYSDNVITLRGNHEQLLIDAVDNSHYYAEREFYNCGGRTTINSYLDNLNITYVNHMPLKDIISESHMKFYNNMPNILETNNFIFVHAGLAEGYKLEEQHSEDTLWIREEFVCSKHYFGKPVIYGHTPIQNNKKTIPNGIVFNVEDGKLNKLCLDGGITKYRLSNIRTAILDDINSSYVVKTYS